MSTRVPLIFGTMTLGTEGKNTIRIHDLQDGQKIIDCFLSYGHKELDTARMYGEGTTEAFLSQLDLHDATIDTKVYPKKPGEHKPAALRATFLKSLETLHRPKVRVLYLHAPDRTVPFEETLRETNELYKEGLFEILGLSNYASWEVAEIVTICRANGWVQPKIYQAMYNAITREIEPELVPCCRKFDIRVVVYNPLAGGFFAGKIASPADAVDKGSRFDASSNSDSALRYRERYLHDGYFRALQLLKGVADKHGLRLTEIALRWCQHHSALTPQDGVILGVSSIAQLEQNCKDSEGGPLPEEVVQALDEAHKIVGMDVPKYWR